MARRESGGWGYHALLPPDADTTTWVLRLARLLQAPDAPRLAGAREFVAGLTSGSGAVATYERAAVPQLREFLSMDGTYDGWCAEHTCVTAAAAMLDPRSLGYLASAQRPDGSWTGHWWDDDEYTTARAIEALAPHPQHADAVAHGVAWAYARTDGSPFATALAIQAVLAGAGSPQPAAVESLLRAQREDGSWEPSARLRVPGPDAVDPLASPGDDPDLRGRRRAVHVGDGAVGAVSGRFAGVERAPQSPVVGVRGVEVLRGQVEAGVCGEGDDGPEPLSRVERAHLLRQRRVLARRANEAHGLGRSHLRRYL